MRGRRTLATLYYLQKPTREFLPALALMILVLFGGGVAFHFLYAAESLSLPRSLFITYSLIFAEHILPFPKHWLLQALYVVLPPLGLIIILDGIVRFSYQLLRRDDNSPEWMRAMAKTYKNHVVLFGLGHVGVRVLEQLHRLEDDVIIVEKDPQCPNLAYAKELGATVLVGSGRETGILERLNLTQAKSLLMATNDDLANLEVALDARKINPNIRVVLRMFDQGLAAKVAEAFDIDLAFSTSGLSAPLFASASSDRCIMNAFYIGEQLLVVANITINSGSTFNGRNIESMEESGIRVLQIERDGQTNFNPKREHEIREGDGLIIQVPAEAMRRIHESNGDPEPY